MLFAMPGEPPPSRPGHGRPRHSRPDHSRPDAGTPVPPPPPAERSARPSDPPKTLGEWIPQVLREMGLDPAADGARLLSAWETAVGPELAAHSRPQGLRRGIVYAMVPDSAWMQRLQMEKVGVLERLRALLGAERVRDLRLRIAASSEF